VFYVVCGGVWHMAELDWARGETYCARALGRVAPVGRSGEDVFDGVMELRPPLDVEGGGEVCAVCVRAWFGGSG